jgi:hypothetical protein
MNCPNLETLVLSYCSGGIPFYELLKNSGNNLEIYVYGDQVLATSSPYTPLFQVTADNVSKVYVQESLIDGYKSSSSWTFASADKFAALTD